MLKEQQRRDELQNRGTAGVRKRARGDDDHVDVEDARRGNKARYHGNGNANGSGGGGNANGSGRRSYKYEDEESDEARALRVENEREAQRWG